MKTKTFTVLLALLMPALASAGQVSSAFTDIGTARPAGMADAYTAIADDASAIFYNPAGMALSQYKDITFMHVKYKWLVPYNYAAVLIPNTKLRAFGLGMVVSGDDLMDEKTFTLSYAENIDPFVMLVKGLFLGLNLKFHFAGFGNNKDGGEQKIKGSAWGIGSDAGLLWETANGDIRAGLMVKDAFSYISWTSKYGEKTTEYNEGVPLSAAAAVAYRRDKTFTVTAELRGDLQNIEKLIVGFEKTFFTYVDFRAGLSQNLDDESFREYALGLGMGHFEMGPAKEYSFNIDTAYAFERLDNTLKIQTSFKFK